MNMDFTRRVQIRKDEFLRQLPDALPTDEYSIGKDCVEVPYEGGTVKIHFSETGERELGQLELPMMKVGFEFDGLDREAVNNFMEHYDTHKLRGMGG